MNFRGWCPGYVTIAWVGDDFGTVYASRSPLALLAVPTLGWRALSSTHSYWTLNYHYDLVLWAIAAVALTDQAPRLLGVVRPAGRVALSVLIAANLCLGMTRFVGEAPPWSVFTASPTLTAVHRLSTHMAPGSTVAAQDLLGTYLIPKFDVSALDVRSNQPVRYAILFTTVTRSHPVGGGGLNRAPLCARAMLAERAVQSDWRTWSEGPIFLIEFPTPVIPAIGGLLKRGSPVGVPLES